MAARTRTLTQLRDAVADRADVTVSASGVRDTHTIVDARINRAIQRWFDLCASCGDDTRLVTVRTATATSTTKDAANWAPNEYIAQPSGLMLVRSIDIWVSGEPFQMATMDELDRNMWSGIMWGSGRVGPPVLYRLGGTNAAAASLIQIYPCADAVYTVDIRYIPAHTDTSTGADAFDFIAGGEEWVANDAAMQTLLSDGLAGSASYAAMMAMNQKLEVDLAFILAKRNPIHKQDTRGRRAQLVRVAMGWAS